ncbi:MAG TPA: universal stress protein [Sorangium sp.]|nr:universal stress protein [Sorangium sp.]
MSTKLTILHPTDLSPEGELAFAHALRIAVVGESRIRVLHVCPPGDEKSVRWGQFPTADTLLHRWGWLEDPDDEQALADLGFEVEELLVKSHNPVGALLDYLDEFPADIIVFATRGREGMQRWWYGSVAEPVARISKTMSLFVPHKMAGFVDVKTGKVTLSNVLVPVVEDPDPATALRAARALVDALGARDVRVTMVHVGDPKDTPKVHDDDAVLLQRSGNVVDELLAAADEVKANLIVMATKGHQSIFDLLRGSTTEQVLRRAKCPVLAVPVLV